MERFEDNWVDVAPEWLVDPQLGFYLGTSGGKEHVLNQGSLNLFYHPDIQPEHYSRMLEGEEREKWLSIKWRAPFVDQPVMLDLKSKDTDMLLSLILKWEEAEDDILRLKIDKNLYSFQLSERVAPVDNKPVLSEHPKEVLWLTVRALTRLNYLDGMLISERFPNVRRVEACVLKEVASDFFELGPDEYQEIEPGWASIASRELTREAGSGDREAA